MSRENPPWYVHIDLNEYQEHIFMKFENFDGVFPTSGNWGIQHTRYIWYEFKAISTISTSHIRVTTHIKSFSSQHSSSRITNQVQVQTTNPCKTII